MEEWKPVVGYIGLYEVSNLGRVRSLPRMGKYRMYGGCILKTVLKNGYPSLVLSANNRKEAYYVHRLVLQSFVGVLPHNKQCANHKNGNRADNRVENLEWVTSSENMFHSYRELNRISVSNLGDQCGESNNHARLTNDNVKYIKHTIQSGYHCGLFTELAKQFNVSVPTISMIASGHRWAHIHP